MEFNLARVHEAIEAVAAGRDCIVMGERRLTFHDVGDRTRRLANVLLDHGFSVHQERPELAGHQSGQDHLALYLYNGNEYLEGMLGAYKARVAPFNVNYRYVAEELVYLLNDSRARGIVYHSAFAPILQEVRAELSDLHLLLQVADESGNALLPGARWYEEALATAHPVLDDSTRACWSPDDLYILYTGGTTGMPKGVLWRQADIFVAALGGRQLGTGNEFAGLEEIQAAASGGGARMMPAPPFMHGAAHWMAFNAFTMGSTVVLPENVERLDPADILSTVEREGVNVLLIVGDAFGRPLIEEIESGGYDLSSLLMLVNGGAALSPTIKERFHRALPTVGIMDGLGASETGQQAAQLSSAGTKASTGDFTPGPGMCIVSDSFDRVLEAGHDEIGWLAQRGRVPLGYLGDAEKTARTFPVIDGVRYAVPGDRARLRGDGTLELLGRDSVTINSGGEKIYAEEVEQALTHHPAVRDVVVCGRPSQRWGSEVVAVVQLRPEALVTAEELIEVAARHIARFKLPKAFVFRDSITRSPAGKADYRWAKEQALQG
ncbi:MAG: Long-chain-fatty-acid--CoA/3-oxocholest-4-en-26-oate--CoA ligase [Acidimicrobiales bacterium]|nr:MAG: acyl-CoA synthetase [Actinomycetota bacterium]MBV6509575.1 Long-chain-fatty-acid--CoA/3-oxocholest-4-en-26-oate--CoA ligase [Acidimicrobiales bacterium]RIK06563.1 MAG: acyl-CoA synthetase [Acidobacteriota bacterium]